MCEIESVENLGTYVILGYEKILKGNFIIEFESLGNEWYGN